MKALSIDQLKSAITELAQQVYENECKHGFNEEEEDLTRAVYHASLESGDSAARIERLKIAFTNEKVTLIHTELSEFTEGTRKPGPDNHCPEFTKQEVELADALIRILALSCHRGLRLAEATIAKKAYNETRPYKHGKVF